MDFLSDLVQNSQAEVTAEVQRLVEEKGIKKTILDEANRFAQAMAMHILNPGQAPEPQDFPGIDLSDESERDQFLLILDYLESLGLKFTPSILKYESQNANLVLNRDDLCRKLHLRSYDHTPLLVQLIEERYNQLHPPSLT
jgi:hypothetical protein